MSPRVLERLLQQRREVHLLPLRPPIELPSRHPPQLAEPDALHHLHVRRHLRLPAEEVVEPEEPAGPEHPVHVEERELQRGGRHPAAEHVHGVHHVQRVVEEGQPRRDAHVERHDPARRRDGAEGPVEVDGGGHHGDAALPHAHREGAGPAADVEPDPDGPRRGRRREHLVDGELERGTLLLLAVAAGGGVEPAVVLPAGEVEAVLAVVEVRGARAVDKAAEGLALVGGPVDGAVGRGGPERVGVRQRWRRVGRRGGAAAPARQGLAAAEEEPLRRELVVGAGAIDSIRHEGRQQVREGQARVARRRPQLGCAPVGVAPVRQRVRPRERVELRRELHMLRYRDGPWTRRRRGGDGRRRRRAGRGGEEERGQVGAEEEDGVEERAAERDARGGVRVRGHPCDGDGHGSRSSVRVLHERAWSEPEEQKDRIPRECRPEPVEGAGDEAKQREPGGGVGRVGDDLVSRGGPGLRRVTPRMAVSPEAVTDSRCLSRRGPGERNATPNSLHISSLPSTHMAIEAQASPSPSPHGSRRLRRGGGGLRGQGLSRGSPCRVRFSSVRSSATAKPSQHPRPRSASLHASRHPTPSTKLLQMSGVWTDLLRAFLVAAMQWCSICCRSEREGLESLVCWTLAAPSGIVITRPPAVVDLSVAASFKHKKCSCYLPEPERQAPRGRRWMVAGR
uniref:Uncharacterized protein n=1 Tax=Setaria viridis TaxID=4556 RepID=A0A4V6Y7N9_SETVI|nr:hypothetical protein SEVIR_9G115000v2 [Setaria viridis]